MSAHIYGLRVSGAEQAFSIYSLQELLTADFKCNLHAFIVARLRLVEQKCIKLTKYSYLDFSNASLQQFNVHTSKSIILFTLYYKKGNHTDCSFHRQTHQTFHTNIIKQISSTNSMWTHFWHWMIWEVVCCRWSCEYSYVCEEKRVRLCHYGGL